MTLSATASSWLSTTKSMSSRPTKTWRGAGHISHVSRQQLWRHPGFSCGDPYDSMDMARKAEQAQHRDKVLGGQFRHYQSKKVGDGSLAGDVNADSGLHTEIAGSSTKARSKSKNQWTLPPRSEEKSERPDELLPLNRWAPHLGDMVLRPSGVRRNGDFNQEARRDSVDEPTWGEGPSGSRAVSKTGSNVVLPLLGRGSARPSLVDTSMAWENRKKSGRMSDSAAHLPEVDQILESLDQDTLPDMPLERVTNSLWMTAVPSMKRSKATRFSTSPRIVSSHPDQQPEGLSWCSQPRPGHNARLSLQNKKQQAQWKSSMQSLKKALVCSGKTAFSSEAWEVATKATGEEIPKEIKDDARLRDVKFFVANLFGGRPCLAQPLQNPGFLENGEHEDDGDSLNDENEDDLLEVQI
eukprot:gnl/MRDRNA2_/MRDRNA2_258445_c0_seq1.p1 gnl/MRDRNA2_/MRDRNA2_258445_c0~~gnl/MRDRNA2_/MRDRNA2_258445_c0_seq1.p1  ORF type:complete len:410 (-),score=94.19 gnl/MRDRNA2_/MRDRNA2_258445_c0_seq1:113-1342(-)